MLSEDALSEDALSDVLSEFARTLATDFPIQGILDHLVHRIVDILPVDAAGVTLISATTDPQFIAASDEAAMRFERLQTELGEGPCIAAFETDAPISIPNLAIDVRFPLFAERAAAEGLVAVFTFPLRDGERGLGALDLYRESAGELSDAQMAAAQTLADVATAYLLNAQRRADLKASSATEHEALARLRLLDETRTEFLTSVIHELRTPMTSISGYVQLLQESALTADQAKSVSAIARNSTRLTALADDLLTLSSLEQGTVGHELTVLDLRDVVAAGQAAVQALFDGRTLDVTFEVPQARVAVRGNARNLERLVTNLLSNAVKFTPEGGWVRCTLTAADGQARLEVSDDGIGIPEAEQGNLFTRFFRASSALAHAIPGSGLGLAIVDSVVRSHGGDVAVVSTPDLGTTFVIHLPLESTQR